MRVGGQEGKKKGRAEGMTQHKTCYGSVLDLLYKIKSAQSVRVRAAATNGSFEDGGTCASFEPGGGPTGASAVAVGEQRNQSTGARYLDYICGRVYFRGTRGRGTWQERAGACGGDGGHIQRRSLAASFEPGRTGVGGRRRRDPC